MSGDRCGWAGMMLSVALTSPPRTPSNWSLATAARQQGPSIRVRRAAPTAHAQLPESGLAAGADSSATTPTLRSNVKLSMAMAPASIGSAGNVSCGSTQLCRASHPARRDDRSATVSRAAAPLRTAPARVGHHPRRRCSQAARTTGPQDTLSLKKRQRTAPAK